MSEPKNDGGNGHQHTDWILKPRAQWIARRRDEAKLAGDHNFSQLHYARQGVISDERLREAVGNAETTIT